MVQFLGQWWAVVAFGFATLAAGAKTEAYVWQRQASPEVAEAMKSFAPQLSGYCVLAAEVSWPGGRIAVARSSLDYPALARLGRPIGLALRVGAYSGTLAAESVDSAALVHAIVDLLAQARAGGLEPAEFQIDYDCPESKLAGYGSWLLRVRGSMGRQPLVITALPAWLKHPEFAELARLVDGFVLQVHSLDRPVVFNQSYTLCDPDRARGWIAQAAQLGRPFRVALPTHGYLLAFEPGGKFVGQAAEGPRPDWPPGTRIRAVRADAVAMARLAGDLARFPPPHCEGVIWFRLPVASDRLNWSAITFATVLHGEIPKSRLAAEVSWSESGLAEVALVNTGQISEGLAISVALRWPNAGRLLVSDGLGGFRLEMRNGEVQGIVRAADVSADAVLAPGTRIKIAWLRFAHEISLDASLLPAP